MHHDDKNLDLLQNLEFGIIDVYRADPELLDFDAAEAIEALARHYRAVQDGRTPPVTELSPRASKVFARVQEFCEWRLGNAPLKAAGTELEGTPVLIDDVVSSLRKILRSIPRWTKQGGRRGYLDFVKQFLR
jgi:hypothetical protein